MYIAVGPDKSIPVGNIIGIFDTDTSTLSSADTKKFLSLSEKKGITESAGNDIPKSFIVYYDGKKQGNRKNGDIKVCFSEFSSLVLYQRLKSGIIKTEIESRGIL